MSRVSFERLKPIEQSDSPRLSAIRSKSGAEIFTPNYIGLSSRGCIPHLTPDMMRSETAIKGIYTAFEDCMCSKPRAQASIIIILLTLSLL